MYMEMTLSCCGTFKYRFAQEVMTDVVKKLFVYVYYLEKQVLTLEENSGDVGVCHCSPVMIVAFSR
jgi:hypothetical protein